MAVNFKSLHFNIQAGENGESVSENLDEKTRHVAFKILHDKADDKFEKKNEE